jgi:hypothetical protein
MNNVDVAMELISETLRQSTLLLSVFMFFVMIVIVLFGCVIYLCEGGTFTVTSDYPMGAYLRYIFKCIYICLYIHMMYICIMYIYIYYVYIYIYTMAYIYYVSMYIYTYGGPLQ